VGQKVNPHGFRVGVIKDWNSRWFTKDESFGDTLVSDYKVRKYLKEKYKESGVPKIEIERDNKRVRVFLHCAKPGLVIGRGGAEIEKIRLELEAIVGMPVLVNVVEVKNPDVNAQLVAESIAKQLEGRASFRRSMKMSIQRTMRMGAKGIKVTCSGRLAGAEIARTEHYHEGSIPLQTLRADIDYGFAEANTTYGKIGVKVWIYKGEVLNEVNRPSANAPRDARRNDRRDNRNGERRGRRPEGARGERAPREGGRK
jgi:small subunit ribosomal protein S3